VCVCVCVYVRGLRVVWSSGGRVLKSFVLQSPSIQAVWCSFGEEKRSLCTLQGETITVYSPEGGVYAVALPGKFDRIWPLPQGLLAERATGPGETTPNPDSPTYFSLLHPLEELKPLSIFDASNDQSIDEFVCDPFTKVVFTSPLLPFIVTYHERKNIHSFWVLRQSRIEIMKRSRRVRLSTALGIESPDANPLNSSSPISIGEDDDIGTELFLEVVWSQEYRVPRATNFFFSWCSEQKNLLLCMFTTATSRLEMLSVVEDASGHFRLEPYAVIKASACLPIKSTWETGPFHVDIIVQVGPTLALYSGKLKICDIQLPCGPSPSPRETKPLDCEKVYEIRDAVANRFSVVMTSRRVCRFSISTSPDCALVKSCIHALRLTLPQNLTQTLRVGYIQHLKRSPSCSEWSVLSRMIQELMLPDSFLSMPSTITRTKSPAIVSPSTPRSRLGVAFWEDKAGPRKHVKSPVLDGARDSLSKAPTSPWTQLLESEFHKQYSALPLEAVPLPCSEQPLEPTPGVWSVDAKAHLPKFLEALHYVYEDIKLNALARWQLRRIARLLFLLALHLGQADYVDYYIRDVPGIADSVEPVPISKTPSSGSKPPDLHQWLLHCIRGKVQEPYCSDEALADHPYQLSRKICQFYTVLTSESETKHGTPTRPFLSPLPFLSPVKSEREEFPFFSPASCIKVIPTHN